MLANIFNIDYLEVIKDDFIELNRCLKEAFQSGFLYEDMFLGKSRLKNIYLDIGWVSLDDSFENGYFKILLVEGEKWDIPLIRLEAVNKEEFIQKLELALLFLKKYEKIID